MSIETNFVGNKTLAQKLGEFLIRYGLVVVLGWIGAMKFTAYEAEGIKPLVASSPLMSWMYRILSLQATSNVIGIAELTAALLIAIRPFSPRLSVIGSIIAVLTFLTTLTFLFSLPGWEKSLGGFPALSGSGGFLLKDLVLLGGAFWTLGESLAAAPAHASASRRHFRDPASA
ncbi:MAG TPA: DUF417 family protein [Pyrinomonadaceae bacterium]|nr:DUF417 family protein [Pyrinomonadaceae bacterium]